ncbi:unnamed protein product [Fusarium graminearum]|uniref:Chromosome 1, complete genome n=2 Tax=Fusarium sambucinum species complex TaxID=569360 RepID=A0A1C3YHL8_GIBZE|nr:hypothetical protein FAUST_182 [Fusarium austroamericanum]KAI6761987.1 hypothetical protein HG531_002540 [Fusarium graminearum]PCD18192.1 hypothetical protein FGRA07_06829 [Fusarium graminearum]CAF3602315.1 unnamed protein product [Fusarium graminearum]CAG2002294.1 unnamed protein product [Fusarium graminearum]
MPAAWRAAGLTDPSTSTEKLTLVVPDSYNRYLAIAARVVRRSLKDDKRIVAERRGEMDLRFSKWENGKQGEMQNLAKANAAIAAENAA